jgi:hypothetical protein
VGVEVSVYLPLYVIESSSMHRTSAAFTTARRTRLSSINNRSERSRGGTRPAPNASSYFEPAVLGPWARTSSPTPDQPDRCHDRRIVCVHPFDPQPVTFFIVHVGLDVDRSLTVPPP